MTYKSRIKNIKSALVCMLVTAAAMFMLCMLTMSSATAADVQTAAPNAANCAVYHYNWRYNETSNPDPQTPMLYMWGVSDIVTVRVYRTSTGTELLGQAQSQTTGSCCIVPLDGSKMNQYGSNVYVTQQAAGEAESERITVSYSRRNNPSVNFSVYGYKSSTSSSTGSVSGVNDGGYLYINTRGEQLYTPRDTNTIALQEGKYYMVDVTLSNFGPMNVLTLPIKYNPEVWQLVQISGNYTTNGVRYTLTDNLVDTGSTGAMMVNFQSTLLKNSTTGTTDLYSVGGYPSYGIGIYPDLETWGGVQRLDNVSATPYLNTETGLLRLQFSLESGVTAPVSNAKIVRLYFKCIKTPTVEERGDSWEDSPLLHFATLADVPESSKNPEYYYYEVFPEGAQASIQGIDILGAKLAPGDGVLYSESAPLTLSGEQILTLPQSIAENDEKRELGENQVHIYNYTNSEDSTLLDYPMEDVLMLTPSITEPSAARPGDIVSVYDPNYLGSPIVDPVEITGTDGIIIMLGIDNLDPEGGMLYISVTRNGIETPKFAVSYGAEVDREVYFKLYSTNHTGAEDSRLQYTVNKVAVGDQIELKIYFNNFEDLLSYTFALHFDPAVVQAADADFDMLKDDGYISEEAFRAGESCLALGEDMADITLNEYIIYELWARYAAAEDADVQASINAEIADVMSALGIETRSEFDEIGASVETIYAQGAAWRGGLVFTGAARAAGTNGTSDPGREESSLYPYADNETGLIKLSAASLCVPESTLYADTSAGYHVISVYFVAKASGDPGFRLAKTSDGVGAYDAACASGARIILAGPGDSADSNAPKTVYSHAYSPLWLISPKTLIEKVPHFLLESGNLSAAADVMIYSGQSFTDPGFTLWDNYGIIAPYSSVTRYYLNGEGNKIELPDFSDAEQILNFVAQPLADSGKYSASFTLVYEFSYPADSSGEDGAQSVISVSRDVFVAFQRGDFNGDSAVNVFDLQHAANFLSAAATLPNDSIFVSYTADFNSDSVFNSSDFDIMNDNLLGLAAD